MKYSPEIVDKIIKYLKQGTSITTTCDLVKISVETFYDWKKNKPEFSERVKAATAIPDQKVENAFFKSALGFKYKEKTVDNERKTVRITTKTVPPNGSNALNWLKNRKPTEWRDKQEIDHSGTVTHGVDKELGSKLDKAIDALIDDEKASE